MPSYYVCRECAAELPGIEQMDDHQATTGHDKGFLYVSQEPLTPRQVYQQERERAAGQGKPVMRRRGEVGQIVSGEATRAQLEDAKRVFERMNQQKTHRHNRNL